MKCGEIINQEGHGRKYFMAYFVILSQLLPRRIEEINKKHQSEWLNSNSDSKKVLPNISQTYQSDG
jgi:hypothetical protein